MSGAEGAQKAVAGIAGAATEAFLPGFGQAATAFVDQLITLGPEGAKAQIEAFVEALPEVIDVLAESIPVVAEVLAENADKIILALNRAIPLVAVELAKNSPQIAIAFIKRPHDFGKAWPVRAYHQARAAID